MARACGPAQAMPLAVQRRNAEAGRQPGHAVTLGGIPTDRGDGEHTGPPASATVRREG